MARARNRPARIVIIDDDESMLQLLTLHLRNGGYEVLAAQDAAAGGRLVLERSPDLVICDVDMPYLNGYQLVAALKGDPATREIPIVFLTVQDDVADQAARLGAVAYLRKPVMADRLLEVVALFAT